MARIAVSSRIVTRKLPQPVAETLNDLRIVGRYLDHVADTALSDTTHVLARMHGSKVWLAVDRVEALAELVEDFVEMFGDQMKQESRES